MYLCVYSVHQIYHEAITTINELSFIYLLKTWYRTVIPLCNIVANVIIYIMKYICFTIILNILKFHKSIVVIKKLIQWWTLIELKKKNICKANQKNSDT